MAPREDAHFGAVYDLPSLTPVLQHVSAVMADPGCSAAHIVEALKLDPGIAARILRLANSAYIGIPRTVASLHHAVVILGQRRIHSLVLTASVLSALKMPLHLPFGAARFWKHSIVVASIAESIAQSLRRYDAIETGEVFSAGLLHDVGKLILGMFRAVVIGGAYSKSIESGTPFFENEPEAESHTSVGAEVARSWNLPESLVNAIGFHHDPRRAPAQSRLVMIVHTADIIAHGMQVSIVSNEISPSLKDGVIDDLHVTFERLKVIAQETMQNQKQLDGLIEFIA